MTKKKMQLSKYKFVSDMITGDMPDITVSILTDEDVSLVESLAQKDEFLFIEAGKMLDSYSLTKLIMDGLGEEENNLLARNTDKLFANVLDIDLYEEQNLTLNNLYDVRSSHPIYTMRVFVNKLVDAARKVLNTSAESGLMTEAQQAKLLNVCDSICEGHHKNPGAYQRLGIDLRTYKKYIQKLYTECGALMFLDFYYIITVERGEKVDIHSALEEFKNLASYCE